MLLKSRRLLEFRKSIVRLLTQQLGYWYENTRKENLSHTNDLHHWMWGPRVDDMLYSYLDDINTGEAHYRTDIPATIMDHLGDRQIAALYRPMDDLPSTLEARWQMYDLLHCGYEFEIKRGQCGYDRKLKGRQYGVVQFVNWLDPTANHFKVHECWHGVKADGVAWDLIITINGIPLVAVMIAPTTEGHRPCEEAYQQMRAQLDADPRLRTYCLLCLISDGKTTLVGTPDDPPEWFLPWEILPADQQRAEQLDISPRLHPFLSLLDKERLIQYLRHFVRLVGEDENQMLYAATCHQVHAVLAAGRFMAEREGKGYAVLPQSDEAVRAYPFETSYETTRRLFHDYLLMSDLLDDVEEGKNASIRFVVEPRMSNEPLEGVCVYRPQGRLHSPLADD